MRILPQPTKVNIGSGTLTVEKGFSFSLSDKFDGFEKIVLKKLEKFDVVKNDERPFLQLLYKENLDKEEYEFLSDEKGVKIFAEAQNGLFYGLMTFLQFAVKGFIPYAQISDKPRFAYRGIMVDVARHFFGKEVIKELLDNMAYYKLNTFHWHLTEDQGWRIEIKKYPDLALKGSIRKNEWKNLLGEKTGEEYGKECYFTQEDIKEVVECARQNFITVIPEIDMPGHLTSALSVFPNLSCEQKPLEVSASVGVKDTVGCISNPDFIAFCKDIIDEVCDLFPAPYFHIGGDEVPRTKWKVCPRCQQFMKEHSLKKEGDLQGWFSAEIRTYLETKGKHTIGWNEILESDDLPKETLVQWWTGNKEKPLHWLENGGQVILSQCRVCYLDYPYILTNLEKIYRLGPEILSLPQSAVKNILGIEAPLWTEFVYTKEKFDFNMYPRMQAVAEAGWTMPEQKNYTDFTSRLSGFLSEMEEKGITYCPPSKYNPIGFKGLFRRIRVGRKWIKDPDYELHN